MTFTGAGVALVTPFADGKVDFPALEALIDWQIENEIDAIISCGTTGEASTLSDKEHIDVVKFTIDKVRGRVPVIAGAGSNDTKHAVEMSKALIDAGADGLLMVTPYYNKCTQKGLIEHYLAIADEITVPMIIYSVQGRTGVNISPFAVSRLCRHPNICGIKEASGNISQVVDIAKYCSDQFALYSGNDDSTVPFMALGGKGVISTAANIIPRQMHRMVQDYIAGDTVGAAKQQIELKPLIDALFAEVNPIPVKAALAMMGKIRQEYRLPLCAPSEETLALLQKELKNHGLVE
ncbi:4-hydroxy-tetrahydrodipicolinate synthase [Bacilliculturomica massiliensis]|uniref:4-hydroxy-tetrahydrodipicolinate synthase n=1 Tax=Bacilliculturomica massiliensis TaxID=1917867 RepID=UPI0010307A61|nr:4-hydroxy-tetrahydrodipicolinate synthase [Bacilliculturomica massiliensis]